MRDFSLKKIVIVMSYYNRKPQTVETIKSITKTKHNNYDIIIVDDCSNEKLDYDELKAIVGEDNRLYILTIEKMEKDWNNPVIVLNKGIFKAIELNPDIIIIQNSEAYHYGDILKHANDKLTEKNYFSYGCFSINQELTNKREYDSNLKELLLNHTKIPIEECGNGWYNHPKYNPRGFDFCAAILTENLKKINGYDERYAKCIWYGDDDLKLRIERLGLNINITSPENEPIVIHQWHDHGYIEPATEAICKQNGFHLFLSVKNNNLNNYVAVHTKTPNFNNESISNW